MKTHFTFQQKSNTWGNKWKGWSARVSSSAFGLLLIAGLTAGHVVVPKTVSAAEMGSVVITEFMADPAVVSDANGEWIELENKSNTTVSLANWDISTNGTSGSTISGNISLRPGDRAVICKNIDTAANGGVVCNASSSFSLAQSGERTIILRDQNNSPVHTVTYNGTQDVISGGSNYVLQNGAIAREETYKYHDDNYGTPAHNQILNDNLAYITAINTTDLNKNGRMDFNGETGIHNTGWTVRLYDAQWNSVPYGENGSNEVTTTPFLSQRPSVFRVLPGDYFLCQASRAGRPQSFVASVTSWVTWDDNGVSNASGNSDEDETCISVADIRSGQRGAHKFGNIIESELTRGQILITSVDDVEADGTPDWNEDEKHQAGWEIRLYDENWQYVATTTTNDKPFFPAGFTVPLGKYYTCEVLQEGYAQSFVRIITSWTTWPTAGTPNYSGQNDEGAQCIGVDVAADATPSLLFGNIPQLSQQVEVNEDSEPNEESTTISQAAEVTGRQEDTHQQPEAQVLHLPAETIQDNTDSRAQAVHPDEVEETDTVI